MITEEWSIAEFSYQTLLLVIRLINLVIVVTLLTLHVKSFRIFRWEQSISGGLFVTYCLALVGLALCAGTNKCGGTVLQVYLTGLGSLLLTINAVMLWRRWHSSGDMTRIVAELLITLGVRIQRQIMTKAILSALAALLLLIDLTILALTSQKKMVELKFYFHEKTFDLPSI